MQYFRHNSMAFFLLFLLSSPTETKAQIFRQKDSQVQKTGDIFLAALPVSTMATTLILKDKKGTWQFVKSFGLNLAVTGFMKVAINKRRPFEGGDYAFPSGHTSITFQSASFIHRRYGLKYSLPAYALAGFTAFSRLNAERHDGYDILSGAVVGIGSTLFFTTKLEKDQVQLTLVSEKDFFMIGFDYRF